MANKNFYYEDLGRPIAPAADSFDPNILVEQPELTRVALPYRFHFLGGFPADIASQALFDVNNLFTGILMPANGSIVKASLKSTLDRAAGTLTAKPTVNGVETTEAGLILVLDGGTLNEATGEVVFGIPSLSFTAGQLIGVKLTSDAAWLPTTASIEVWLYVVFSS